MLTNFFLTGLTKTLRRSSEGQKLVRYVHYHMIFLAKCVRERTWGNLHAVYLSCSTLLCNLPQKVSPLFSQPSFEIISIDREPNELLWLLWNYASKVQKPTSKRRITSNKSRLQKIEFKVGYSLEWDSFGPKYHHRISTSLNVAGGGETRGFDSRAFFLESFTTSVPPSSWGLMADPTRV